MCIVRKHSLNANRLRRALGGKRELQNRGYAERGDDKQAYSVFLQSNDDVLGVLPNARA